MKTVKYFLLLDNTTPGKAAVLGGCLLNAMVTFDKRQLLSSVVFTAIGAVVSYFMSRLLKMQFERTP